MLLIATDEAGYGPKLGPLVVTATAWRLPDSAASLSNHDVTCFAHLAAATRCDGLQVVVNDSKAVFKPKSSGKSAGPAYRKLELAALAGSRWSNLAQGDLALGRLLDETSCRHAEQTPWLAGLVDQEVDTEPATPLLDSWGQGDAKLVGILSRLIPAAEFNRFCSHGANKSDLLSQSTLQLIRQLLKDHPAEPGEPVAVYCDRHGGRRYYAGPIQAVFDGPLIQVLNESKGQSAYRVPTDEGAFTIEFTVKGDSFTPVAFSSMVAKYLREKSMELMNRFFDSHQPAGTPLRPTAGYPVDADRFLTDIAPTVKRLKIDRAELVRCS